MSPPIRLRCIYRIFFLFALETLATAARANTIPTYDVTNGTFQCYGPNVIWTLLGPSLNVTVGMNSPPNAPCLTNFFPGDQLAVNTVLGLSNDGLTTVAGTTSAACFGVGPSGYAVSVTSPPLTVPGTPTLSVSGSLNFNGLLTVQAASCVFFAPPAFDIAFAPAYSLVVSLQPTLTSGSYWATGGSFVATPEPGTIALFGTGLLVIAAALRRNWARQHAAKIPAHLPG